ncbi:MAG: c-type cytochrome [Anaerolineales bacterium]
MKLKRGVLPLALAGSGLLILSLVPSSGDPGGGSTPPPTVAAAATDEPAAYGRALFQAKGCVGCHQHRAVNPGSGVSVGPELSSRSYDPDFLRSWLKDPPAVRPGTQMPNLRLSAEEIEALIAFLVSESS